MAKSRSKVPLVAEVIETSDPNGHSGVYLAVQDGDDEVARAARVLERAETVSVGPTKSVRRSSTTKVEVKAATLLTDKKSIVTRSLKTSERPDDSDRAALSVLHDAIDIALQHLRDAEALKATGEQDLAEDYCRFAREALEAVTPAPR